ncbi:MAG: hypothetical protein RIS76_3024 [Verrucomicrobiota bacterium]|jgi:type IV pilus assembly protein PilB
MELAAPNRGLVDRLLSSGLIGATQLELAQNEQRRRGGSVLKVVSDLGFVPAERLCDFVAAEAGTRRVDVLRHLPDRAVVDRVPEDMARRLRALPLSLSGRRLTVALADPFNVLAIDELQRLTGLEIEVVTSTEREILNALDHFGVSMPSIQESIERIIDEGDNLPKISDLAETAASDARAEDAPVIQIVNQVIQRAALRRASDIHFEPQDKMLRIRLRIDGALYPDALIPKALQSAVIARMKILAELDVTESRVPQDGRASAVVNRRRVNLRVSSLPTQYGESVVVRLLDTGSQIQRMDQLGLAPDAEERLRAAIGAPHGVVIVTGPTGSGKTTTLYSVLNEINSPDISIFTLEDPVEIPMAGIRQTQIREEVGLTFGSSLRSLLRQDPDVILVGETRDTETATLMIRAALTGHLVFSTLHTNDAAGAIPRLLDMGVEPYLLPNSLVAIVAQRLVRRLCPQCRARVEDPEGVFRRLGVNPPTGMVASLWRSVGCSECLDSGFRGRQAIFEILTLDERFHSPIISRAAHSEFARLARESGMRTMFEDGLVRAADGVTTVEELLQATRSH